MALPVFQRTIVTEAGDVIAGAEVEVVLESTGLAADIFSDRAGNTPRTNPFFTGADGFAKFFAAPDEYRITATGPTGSIVFRFVVLTNDAALMNNNTGGNTLNTLAAQNANSVNISGGAIASTNVTGGTVNPTTLQQGGSQAYVRSNIVGTVSQSSGVPTGAIIQSGSNANGGFVRYADGTLICSRSNLAISFINVFVLRASVSPAATFANSNYSVLVTIAEDGAGSGLTGSARPKGQCFGNSLSPSSIDVGFQSNGNLVSSESGRVCYTAIGLWF